MSDEKADRLIAMLECLAQRNRLLILDTIIQGGKDGGRLHNMMKATGLTQPTVSNHLHHLLERGLVTKTTVKPPVGRRFKVWRINLGALDEVQQFIKSMQASARS